MAEFIRARSAEQKGQRLEEIKGAVRRQFAARPYHEITLTTIADELGWSRANLYKYVSTKEEVFLLLTADEMDAYFNALLTALPEGCGLAPDTVAEVWAGIANAHQEYFRLGDLLTTIVETNVTVERLMAFKRAYYDHVQARLLRPRSPDARAPAAHPRHRARARGTPAHGHLLPCHRSGQRLLEQPAHRRGPRAA